MSFKSQQKTFDDVKWFDSILAGEDKCGTYEFCGDCNKDESYPCARAGHRYSKMQTRLAGGYIRIAVICPHK